MGVHLERALILFEQARHALAEKELQHELASEPDSAMAHALLGLCLAEREAYDPATSCARTAVTLAPDHAFAHYALASIFHDRHSFDDARRAIDEAIRLDPTMPNYFALLASIHYDQQNWPEALAAAERGLAQEADHVGCSNMRALALVKLGRDHEAGAVIQEALRREPENAVTHANRGWTLLNQGQPMLALEHFREALRLDPDFEAARRGVIEALKARFLVYRLLLRFFLWLGRLTRPEQWLLIIGGGVGYAVLNHLAERHPALAPWVWPLLLSYLLFGVLSWIADPLFNLLLRLDPAARRALSREQVVASNVIGSCLLAAALALAVWGATAWREALFAAAVFGLLVIPTAGVFDCRPGRPRTVMKLYTWFLVVLGVTSVTLMSVGHFLEGQVERPVVRGFGAIGLYLYVAGAFFSGCVTLLLMTSRRRR